MTDYPTVRQYADGAKFIEWSWPGATFILSHSPEGRDMWFHTLVDKEEGLVDPMTGELPEGAINWEAFELTEEIVESATQCQE